MDRLSVVPALLFSFLLSSRTGTSAFQVPFSSPITTRTASSISSTQLAAVQLDPQAPRNYNGFVEWASYYGLSQENIQISEQYGEWGAVAGQAAQAGSRVLYVPASLRLTSPRVRQEEFAHLEPIVNQYIDATNSNGNINLACQFYLFLKVLQEYDQGEQSPYFPWLDALPRKFNTALTWDDVEMDCLPPFVKFLAQQDRFNFELFMEILPQISTPSISDATKSNYDITKWAFNVVFTRARAAFGESEIIPMADMINHAADPNVEVQYDNEGNVHVTLLRDVQAGESLYKCYGQHTNPSRFLATYGFFDTSPPATYCKLMAGKKLTPELVNLGFVFERMVFYVESGAIADEVWDVMLYTVLEQIDPAVQQQFYNAHLQGDTQTKEQLHQFYKYESSSGLLQHVNEMLNELASCSAKANQNPGHEHMPMIQQHNDFVRQTFLKVQNNLEQIQMRAGSPAGAGSAMMV